MPVKLIVHALIEKDGKYLLIKRSKIKRGLPNMYPEYWDIPGGSVEEDELPREGAVRETMEEVNQKIQLSSILHEDSCYDDTKGICKTPLLRWSRTCKVLSLMQVDARLLTSSTLIMLS